MNSSPLSQQREKLERLQSRADAIRKDLGFSKPNELIYRAELFDTKTVEVVADGLGGATTLLIDGNYPVDYTAIFEAYFSSEEEATTVADSLVEENEIL